MIKKLRNTILIILVLVLIASPLFIKVKVECRSQSGGCPEEMVSKFGNLKGKNLFQARRQASQILRESYLISESSMRFKLPNVLLVQAIVKKPAYAILNKTNGNYLLLDRTGTLLNVSDKTSHVILVKETSDLKPGQVAAEEDLFALKIIEGVDQMYQIPSGVVRDNSLVVDLPQGIRVIFPMKDAETDVLLGSLRLIYNKITTDYPGVYTQIDMRYKNPILR